MSHKWEIKSKDFDANANCTNEYTATVKGNYSDVIEFLHNEVRGELVSLNEMLGRERRKYERCFIGINAEENTNYDIFNIY